MASTGNHFQTVADAGALDTLFARSHEAPVLLFKHSNACPISAAAYEQMSRVKGDVSIVVVQQSRDLSREVATRTGVPHESPQVLVLRDIYGQSTEEVANAMGLTPGAVKVRLFRARERLKAELEAAEGGQVVALAGRRRATGRRS